MPNNHSERFLGRHVHAHAWHPEGLFVASVGSDDSARIWEAETGKEIATATSVQGAKVLAFSPDGKLLAVSGREMIRVFSVSAAKQIGHKPLCTFVLDEATTIHALAWSPDSSRLAFASNSWGLFIWEVRGGPTQRTFSQSVTGSLTRLKWSPTGQMIAWLKSGVDAVQVGSLADEGRYRLFFGHRRCVQDLSWSPDGETIASCAAGHDDQTVQIWNAISREVWLRYQEHTRGVLSVCYSPDGCWIATSDLGGEIRIWIPQNGKTVCTWRNEAARLSNLSWSPNGQFLSASDDSQGRILILPMQGRLPAQSSEAVAGYRGEPRQVLPPRDRYIVRTTLQEERAPTELDALFLARTLIVEAGATTVQLLDSETGAAFYRIEAPDWGIRRVRPDLYLNYLRYYAAWHKQREYSGAWFGYRDVTQKLERGDYAPPETLVWELELDASYHESQAKDLATDQRRAQYHTEAAKVCRQAATEIVSSQKLGAVPAEASASRGDRLPWVHPSHFAPPAMQKLRPTSDYEVTYSHDTSKYYSCEIRALCWSHDGLSLVTSNGYDGVTHWSAETGKRLARIPDSRWTNTLAISPDNSRLALGSGQFVRVVPYPPISGSSVSEELGITKKCPDRVTQVAWLPDGEHFVTSVSRGAVQLWRMSGKREVHSYWREGQRWVEALALSPCGQYLALVLWMGGASPDTLSSDLIEVREVATGRVVTTYQGHTRGIQSLAWSPDGEWIVSVASGYDDHTAHVWRALTGEQRLIYAVQERGLRCVDISPDGQYAVTGGYDSLVCVWNIATGETVQVFNQYDGITRVAFSPDGTRLAAGDFSGRVRIWPRDTSYRVG